jgi:hypothetical protein
MKLKLPFLVFICLAIKSSGQNVTKVFDEVKKVNIRSSGVIKKNNVVKGYYNFYEFDKVDRKTRLFKLNLLDENLNEIGTKEIEGPKEWELVSGGFDGNNFCFKFWDEKAKSFELKVYDQKATEINTVNVKINYKPTGMKYTQYHQVVSPEINIDDNNGFLDYTFDDDSNSFLMAFVGATPQKSWSHNYSPESKAKFVFPNYLNGNADMVITGITRIEPGLYSTKTTNTIVANSVKDGSQLFDVSTEFDDDTHVVPIDAVFENGKITVIGLNYKKAKTFTSPPDGLAFIELDKTGKVLKTNFKSFEESLGKYLPMENGKLDGGYFLYIHDIVKTKNNTNLVIAEKFKKSGGAAALSALSALSGGSFVKLQLQNMVVIEYDKDGNVIQAQEIPKAQGTTEGFPSYTGFLSPYLLAAWANMMGEMDYAYTMRNEDNSEVTFSFVDYDRLDEDAKKTKNFGQIKYKNGKFTTDKIAIKKEKADWATILPAKSNYVIQVNYFKKTKKLQMDMVKLNN